MEEYDWFLHFFDDPCDDISDQLILWVYSNSN
jgi:hypothetical protein